jgi:hypothetical protein
MSSRCTSFVASSSLGFMVESLKELLYALSSSKHGNSPDTILAQYAKHITNYVQQVTGISAVKTSMSQMSLVSSIGPDLCDHVMSFVDPRDLTKVVYVCKKLNQCVQKLMWKEVRVMFHQNGMKVSSKSHSREVTLDFHSSAWKYVRTLHVTMIHWDSCDESRKQCLLEKIKTINSLTGIHFQLVIATADRTGTDTTKITGFHSFVKGAVLYWCGFAIHALHNVA